jgi:molybdopterin-guanine dinucleotide biosynthesis protein A
VSAPDLPLDGVTGIVLAGGRAARFGSDKLAADLDGRPVLHHALAAVGLVAARIVLVVAPGAAPALPAELEGRIRVVHDREAFGGPLFGLATALDDVSTPVAVIAGGDMPRLVPTVLQRLAVTVGARTAAAFLDVPGRVQPLPMAVDTTAARAAAARARARGARSLRELLAEMGAVAIPAPVWLSLDPRGATITDIDRPSDLDR